MSLRDRKALPVELILIAALIFVRRTLPCPAAIEPIRISMLLETADSAHPGRWEW